jgi:hypothetical protein
MSYHGNSSRPGEWTLRLYPDPPHDLSWLDLTTTTGEPPVRIDLTTPRRTEVKVSQVTGSPAEQLLVNMAMRLLTTGAIFPQDILILLAELALEFPGPLPETTDGLGDVIAALQACGALPPLSPVPSQLAALCAHLNLTGHGITVPPGRDLPEPWLSMLTHRQRTTTQTPRERDGCVAVAAALPDLDGIRLSILGLTSSADGTVLHTYASGPMRGAYYGSPERNLAPAIWIRDSRGGWHATRVSRPREGDITMRLEVVPPLSRSSDWIEVIVTGPSAEARAALPLRWQLGPYLAAAEARNAPTPVQPGRAMVRLISMRAVKVVAAATAVCVAALSACTASPHSPVTVPANIAPPPGGMPGYYVVVAGREVVVRASGDGHVTGSVAIPVAAGNARSPVGGEPFASADGRHFAIVVSRGGDLPGVADVTLFRLTVSPGGQPGELARLAFDSRGVPVTGAALSPDGRLLALSLVNEFPPAGALNGSVEVINVASGTTRTWTGRSTPGYWPGVPSWTDDGAVVVPWWHDTGHGMFPAEITGVRRLDLGAPGGSLAAARLTAFPAPVLGAQSAMITPGGGGVITSSCRAGGQTASARVDELSTTDGRLIRVLRTQTARFGNDADATDAVFSQCQVLSVAGDGDHVLVQAFALGRIDNGSFTSLPGTTPRVRPVSAAW